jgi:hypothetical protein
MLAATDQKAKTRGEEAGSARMPVLSSGRFQAPAISYSTPMAV